LKELILRSLQGQTTPEQEVELERWRSASPDHERDYQAMVEVWQGTAPAERLAVRRPPPTLEDLEGRAQRSRAKKLSRTAATGFRKPLAWAAMVILSLGMGLIAGQQIAPAPPAPTPQVSEVVTGPGELATTTMPDGSVARLGPGTRLRTSVGTGERWVEVDGQVFLSVSSDSTRPFHVRTAGGEATVLGTRFEVNARHDQMDLLVVEGAVAVQGGGDEVQVRAGQRSRSRTNQPPQVEIVEDPEELLGWMGAFVAFEATPLPRVARELERRMGISIQIMDPELQDRTVTGWFTEADMDHVVDLVCRAAAVTCAMSADTLRIFQ
jgi:transmembrane sensor